MNLDWLWWTFTVLNVIFGIAWAAVDKGWLCFINTAVGFSCLTGLLYGLH